MASIIKYLVGIFEPFDWTYFQTINFFQDFECSNPRFEVESCEKVQKTTFGEGQDSILELLGHGSRNPAKFLSGE
jgi:hypothetical protein